ncbi:MAG: C25 family cysteine peptidase, partial [Candidatus Zixiibacteriota bacterium]
MSRILKIIITTLMLIEISIANDEATFSFEPSFLLKNSDCFQVSYSDYNLTPLGRQISLPSKTYFVELSDTNSSIELNWTVIKKDLLYKFEVEDIYGDIPTTDIFNRYSNVTPSARKVELGSAPILSEDIVYVGDKRWVKFLVFPVTIDNSGQLYFNQTITLTIGSQIIKPEQLVTIDKVYKKPAKISYSSHIEIFGGNIEYLIITSALLQEPFERLALYKSSVGIKTKVELIEEILPLYSGRDDAEKLREYLKQFYTEGGRYVLLGGDETQLPLRYAYPNSADEPPPLDQQQICDLYFADLTGEWDVDNDNIWGEKNVDQADLNPELKVGRVPFSTVQEADNFVDKIIQYETNPGGDDPSYLEKVFFFTSDQMRDYSNGGQHGRIAAVFPEQFYIDTVNGIEIASGNDLTPTNLSSSQLVPILSDGYGIVNII